MMHRLFLFANVLISALLVTACASQEMQLPAAAVETQQVFKQRCAACHALPHPARHSADQWPHILALMERRMRERQLPPLKERERSLISQYLAEHAR